VITKKAALEAVAEVMTFNGFGDGDKTQMRVIFDFISSVSEVAKGEVKRVSVWISEKIQLPESPGKYLVYLEYGDGGKDIFVANWIPSNRSPWAKWGMPPVEFQLWWMSLPEPPLGVEVTKREVEK
jgi:hypothetical protein